MTYLPVKLTLFRGQPSGYSMGLPAVFDPSNQPPQSIDLLHGVYAVQDEGAASSFRPKVPVVKNGGLWVDSPTLDGRELIAAKRGNVLETIILKSLPNTASGIARANAQSLIYRMVEAAGQYSAREEQLEPVYLEWWAQGAPGPQYALVIMGDVDLDTDGLNPANPSVLTLNLEREPAWRGLAPGSSSKIWTLLDRGLKWTTKPGSTVAGVFNYSDVSPIQGSTGAGKESLVEVTIKRIHELGMAGVTNFAIVPAASIPGNAPALASIYAETNSVLPTYAILGRSTRRELYPAGTPSQKIHNMFNGVDATFSGGAGALTVSKFSDGFGNTNSSITPDRKLLRAAGIATGYAETDWGLWGMNGFWMRRRWRVFMRVRVTTGAGLAHFVRVSLKRGRTTLYTKSTSLAGVGANMTLFYIGELDALSLIENNSTGYGVWSTGVTLTAHITKSNDGVAANIDLLDIILIPLDEPSVRITNTHTLIGSHGTDSTGYLNSPNDRVAFAFSNGGADRVEGQGQVMTLEPGVDNYIFYVDDFGGPGMHYDDVKLRINIIPRWYGVRNE